ncbi:uncharacterized protein SCODWIG_01858 [Saccharomycodes ludwigii]|uniref:Mitochondrial group I intron splicing factor CCM1 n=1 Tax=Saccharomycodes ludwigii TaxID=36035 RepID=A0A376B5W8_9ASCO|nr:hypothetical protein SCDLUD_000320 [Saccharomycodes ludwigii]KAH3902734.1 hypothetical protein SCDLUD_000320 [Saccharomycodes ludwigii]SSD60097.1 uncharacterized protein SCODWIG_01858 [Saccharomycodes ludwigii]
MLLFSKKSNYFFAPLYYRGSNNTHLLYHPPAFTRSFQTTTVVYLPTGLKYKLTYLQKNQSLVNKSPSELKKLKTVKKNKLHKLHKTSYSKQQAYSKLTSKYGITKEQLEGIRLGPTSDSDLQLLLLSDDKAKHDINGDLIKRDRRLLYTILGVTGEQLRDAKLVTKDVEKFLKRHQVEKALFLIRLAGPTRGVAGMNKLIEYYLTSMQDAKAAIDLFNWRKKWGILPNAQSYTILFSGIAGLAQPISAHLTKKLMSIIIGLVHKQELNTIHLNSAMDALCNCCKPEHVFHLYDMRPKGIKKDKITYNILLKALGKISKDIDDRQFTLLVSETIKHIPPKYFDSQMAYQLCYCFAAKIKSKSKGSSSLSTNNSEQCENLYLNETLSGLYNYFKFDDIENDNELQPKILPNLRDHWGINEKFELNSHVFGLLIDILNEIGQYKNMRKSFELLLSKEQSKAATGKRTGIFEILTPDIIERYMEYIIKGYPSVCSNILVDVFTRIDENSPYKTSKHMLVLVYKSFIKQAQKGETFKNRTNFVHLLKNFQKFAKKFECVPKADTVMSWKPWSFYFSVFQEGNVKNILNESKIEYDLIFAEYLKSLNAGEFCMKNFISQNKYGSKTDYNLASLKMIELKCVRFISDYITKYYTFADFENNNGKIESDVIRYRRLLLRFKKKLIEHISLIEERIGAKTKLDDHIMPKVEAEGKAKQDKEQVSTNLNGAEKTSEEERESLILDYLKKLAKLITNYETKSNITVSNNNK